MINNNKIYDFMKEKNLTKTAFAKQCKISLSTLNRVLDNENFKLTALFKIARTMKIHIKDLFES